ncbi:hypothetical protein SUGI_0814220 [Cryptomeria japonica]|uniref:protein argonaute 7-like n=1 Tax=Cryptomeria japonica TaxID=3369 RepID=UPI0024146E14|nr:protein argonaute 7-like [Cryptomeria japonica]GLJ39828.1 hypothetical protein SUGI_0814220 [Cryptomeria japonica]
MVIQLPHNTMNQAAENPNHRSNKRIRQNESAPEQRKTRYEYRGGLSVIRFLYHSSILISPHRPLSEGAKNRVTSVLQGMKIRNTHGRRDKKFTFHGLTSDMTRDFVVFVEDGDEKFKLEYEKLPYLDLGMSADGKPIYLPIEWCVIYSKDNKSNQRLRRLVSHETSPDLNYTVLNYPKNTHLENKWRLVFLGQNAPMDTLDKFRKSMAAKCGESGNAEIIHITEPAELKVKLPSLESGIIILVCVMEEEDKPFQRAVKREAELEKGMVTQWCKLEDVEHYCDLYVTDLHESWYVTDLMQEMIAKTGSPEYKAKAFLPHSAFPHRFKWWNRDSESNCDVMYLGCKVINSFPHLTVMVANLSKEDRSTSDYVSRVALGDYMDNLPAIFGELLTKYDTIHDNDLPDKIIFFREGFVGGRIEETLRKEVNDLRKKINSLKNVAIYPPITFIVRDRKSGARSVNGGDGKANYSIFSDESAICCSEFEMLIKNLSYSRRYPKPLPVYYTNRVARLAKVYLEGQKNPNLNKIAETIDRSLYVRRESLNEGEHQNRAAEQQQAEQMDE